MLQTPEEEHQGRSFTILLLCLDGHSKQFCDERSLPQVVSFAYPLHLPFPHHMYDFISLQCSPGRLERKETHAWFGESFDEPLVEQDQAVERTALSAFTRYGKSPFHLRLAEGFGIRRIFVDGDHTGRHGVTSTQRFREKALRCLGITSCTQQELQGVPLRVPLLFATQPTRLTGTVFTALRNGMSTIAAILSRKTVPIRQPKR